MTHFCLVENPARINIIFRRKALYLSYCKFANLSSKEEKEGLPNYVIWFNSKVV